MWSHVGRAVNSPSTYPLVASPYPSDSHCWSRFILRQLIASIRRDTLMIALPVTLIHWPFSRPLTAPLTGFPLKIFAGARGVVMESPVFMGGRSTKWRVLCNVHMLAVAGHVGIVEGYGVDVGNAGYELRAYERLDMRNQAVVRAPSGDALSISVPEPCRWDFGQRGWVVR